VVHNAEALVFFLFDLLYLDGDEHTALVRLVKHVFDTGRFPMSPRLYPLRATLAKLEPQPLGKPWSPPKVCAPPKASATRRRPPMET